MVETFIVTVSEAKETPGNQGVPAAEAQARADKIFHPYQERVVAALDSRDS